MLLAPAEGVPPVLTTPAELDEVAARFAAGTGPIAVDAERASGYRYGQRAYLVQLRRAGAGTALIDPIALPDLAELTAAIKDEEWILHAASQDLACLAEVGLIPEIIFDTELAGRLAGFERVGLGAMVERVLGVRLEKGHSAADWSTRPLPEPWLRYAALDVELLVELRAALVSELDRQGKLEWAREEFAALLTAPPSLPRAEPWRRVSGMHRVRTPRQAALVRALWEARDAAGRRRDLAPGRVLPDSAIMAAALAAPESPTALAGLGVFGGPRMRRSLSYWWQALAAALALPEAQLPAPSAPVPEGPPSSAGRWGDRDPVAADRLVRVRAALGALAEEHALPVENLLEPAVVRGLAWRPPAPLDEAAVEAALIATGARSWQRELVRAALLTALVEPAEPAGPPAEPS